MSEINNERRSFPYSNKNWNTGDIITQKFLNNIEIGIKDTSEQIYKALPENLRQRSQTNDNLKRYMQTIQDRLGSSTTQLNDISDSGLKSALAGIQEMAQSDHDMLYTLFDPDATKTVWGELTTITNIRQAPLVYPSAPAQGQSASEEYTQLLKDISELWDEAPGDEKVNNIAQRIQKKRYGMSLVPYSNSVVVKIIPINSEENYHVCIKTSDGSSVRVLLSPTIPTITNNAISTTIITINSAPLPGESETDGKTHIDLYNKRNRTSWTETDNYDTTGFDDIEKNNALAKTFVSGQSYEINSKYKYLWVWTTTMDGKSSVPFKNILINNQEYYIPSKTSVNPKTYLDNEIDKTLTVWKNELDDWRQSILNSDEFKDINTMSNDIKELQDDFAEKFSTLYNIFSIEEETESLETTWDELDTIENISITQTNEGAGRAFTTASSGARYLVKHYDLSKLLIAEQAQDYYFSISNLDNLEKNTSYELNYYIKGNDNHLSLSDSKGQFTVGNQPRSRILYYMALSNDGFKKFFAKDSQNPTFYTQISNDDFYNTEWEENQQNQYASYPGRLPASTRQTINSDYPHLFLWLGNPIVFNEGTYCIDVRPIDENPINITIGEKTYKIVNTKSSSSDKVDPGERIQELIQQAAQDVTNQSARLTDNMSLLDLLPRHKGYYDENGVLRSSNTAQYIQIPIRQNDRIFVTGADTRTVQASFIYAWMKKDSNNTAYSPISNDVITYTNGQNDIVFDPEQIELSQEGKILDVTLKKKTVVTIPYLWCHPGFTAKAPIGTELLYILLKDNDGNDYTPTSLRINEMDLTIPLYKALNILKNPIAYVYPLYGYNVKPISQKAGNVTTYYLNKPLWYTSTTNLQRLVTPVLCFDEDIYLTNNPNFPIRIQYVTETSLLDATLNTSSNLYNYVDKKIDAHQAFCLVINNEYSRTDKAQSWDNKSNDPNRHDGKILPFNDYGIKLSYQSTTQTKQYNWIALGDSITEKYYSIIPIEQGLNATIVHQTDELFYRIDENDKKILYKAKQDIAIGTSFSADNCETTKQVPHGRMMTNSNLVWTPQVASTLGWELTNKAHGGAGFLYTGGGAKPGQEGYRVARDTNFANYDVVTVSLGINDWKGNVTLGTINSDCGEKIGQPRNSDEPYQLNGKNFTKQKGTYQWTGRPTTIYGAIKATVEAIMATNPFCRIIFTTPLNALGYFDSTATNFKYADSPKYGITYKYNNSKTLEDVYQAIVDVCQFYGLPYIDLTHKSPINKLNIHSCLPDGIHPSLEAHKMIAEHLAGALKSNFETVNNEQENIIELPEPLETKGYFTLTDNNQSEFKSEDNSTAYIVDLSSYNGKTIQVELKSSSNQSQRLTALGTNELKNLLSNNQLSNDQYIGGSFIQSIGETKLNNQKIIRFVPSQLYSTLYISYHTAKIQSLKIRVLSDTEELLTQIHKTIAYVDNSYSLNDSNGTSAAPYKTIQDGINSGAEIVKVKAFTITKNQNNEDTITLNESYQPFSCQDRTTPLDIQLWQMPNTYASSTSKAPYITIEIPEQIPNTWPKTNFGASIRNCTDVKISNMKITGAQYYCFDFQNIQHLEVTRCEAADNRYRQQKEGKMVSFSVFYFNNVNGVIRDCIAHGSQLDGFNVHGYGDTQFINCKAYDNRDDGISHHDGTTGMIIGGEFYGNYKAGVASPTYGAVIDVIGAYSHNNAKYGLLAASDSTHNASAARVSNCVFKNNGTADNKTADIWVEYCDVTAWGLTYDNKHVENGTLTELDKPD